MTNKQIHELPKESDIMLSGKTEHLLPHMWHPSHVKLSMTIEFPKSSINKHTYKILSLQGMQTNHTQSYLTRWWSSRGPSNRQSSTGHLLSRRLGFVWVACPMIFLANRSPCDFQRWDASLATVLLHIWHSRRALFTLREISGCLLGCWGNWNWLFQHCGTVPGFLIRWCITTR